ncbi:uncharacterized protein VTP21DRAFT_8531 [Calcarisporiella thermophila]|uniref:uncharacterized protein n=1 Tax=Calcarisporiella thermophila TaxID=911321 RepID=UPI0037428681
MSTLHGVLVNLPQNGQVIYQGSGVEIAYQVESQEGVAISSIEISLAGTNGEELKLVSNAPKSQGSHRLSTKLPNDMSTGHHDLQFRQIYTHNNTATTGSLNIEVVVSKTSDSQPGPSPTLPSLSSEVTQPPTSTVTETAFTTTPTTVERTILSKKIKTSKLTSKNQVFTLVVTEYLSITEMIASPVVASISHPSSTQTNSNKMPAPLSSGAIFGIACGGLFLLSVFCTLLCLSRRGRKSRAHLPLRLESTRDESLYFGTSPMRTPQSRPSRCSTRYSNGGRRASTPSGVMTPVSLSSTNSSLPHSLSTKASIPIPSFIPAAAPPGRSL